MFDDVAARELGQLGINFTRDIFGEFAGGREQQTGREDVVLGLGEQVGGDVFWIGGIVGNQDRLGGTVETINADDAKDLTLGERGKEPARAQNFVQFGNTVRAVCH